MKHKCNDDFANAVPQIYEDSSIKISPCCAPHEQVTANSHMDSSPGDSKQCLSWDDMIEHKINLKNGGK